MDHHTTAANGVVSRPRLRLRSHLQVKQTIRLHPELYEWVRREAAVHNVTISEQVNRALSQLWHLRKQLSALTSTDQEVPLFQTLLQEHASKMTALIEGAVKTMGKGADSLDLLKAMLVFGVKALLDPRRYSQWEQEVQATMKGRPA